MISIYIHIPFCVRKCKYCDFLSFQASDDLKKAYIEALCLEIELCDAEDRDVYSVFIGGGTPSVLEATEIDKILAKVKDKFNLLADCEVSMECNPGTANYERLAGYRKAGVNRLSIGLQSTNDEELKALGRIHNYKQFVETYDSARKAGFENINIDLMSALPGQNLGSYKNTLTKIVNLKPEHISAYSLIIEENTEFYTIYGGDNCVTEVHGIGKDGVKSLPDEDTEREMYYMTKRILEDAGYHRYEISNYAREGYECRHNKVYWTGGDYISFGIGAASYYKGVRYNNISDKNRYIEIWNARNAGSLEKFDPCTDRMCLSKRDKMEEYMYVGLRLIEGVSISGFYDRFGSDIEEIYGDELSKLKKDGLIEVVADRIRLTERGIDVSNVVLAEFIEV